MCQEGNQVNSDRCLLDPPQSDKDTFASPMELFRKENPKNFIIAHLNINHVRNKYCEVLPWMQNELVDFLALSETKLDFSVTNATFTQHIAQYSMHRQDRTGNGGGLLCFVKSCIPHVERPEYSYNENGIESMVIEIMIRKEKWFIITVYRPPSINIQFLKSALHFMCERCQSHGKSTYIMGDINVDFLKTGNPLCDVMDVYGLKNIITGPTCFKSVENPSSVDVILTDSKARE